MRTDPSTSFREFDSEFILKCCNNYEQKALERKEQRIEEQIQKTMQTKHGFFERKFYTIEEAIEKLYEVNDCGFSEYYWIEYNYKSRLNKISKIIRLCKAQGSDKILLGDSDSYILNYADE